MPVSLSDYSKPLKKAIRRNGYACVFVVSAPEGHCRVNYAVDLSEAFHRLQRTSPVPLTIEGVSWLPDRSIAANVAKRLQLSNEQHRLPGGWFNTGAAIIVKSISEAAEQQNPGCAVVSHQKLVQEFFQKIGKKALTA